jgi:hypothetical protein
MLSYSVPFRASELTLPRKSEYLGMSTFFRGITETIPSLFRGIFSERNSVPNPSSMCRLHGSIESLPSLRGGASTAPRGGFRLLVSSKSLLRFRLLSWDFIIKIKNKNLSGLHYIIPDRMSQVKPPNSNGRTIHLTPFIAASSFNSRNLDSGWTDVNGFPSISDICFVDKTVGIKS